MDTPEGNAAGEVFYHISLGKEPFYKHQGWLSGRVTTDDNFTFYAKPELDENADPILFCIQWQYKADCREAAGGPFQTHGGWPGHVMKDIKNICKGADFSHEMEIQFDGTGGAELVTADEKIEAWVEQVKTDKELK